MRPKVVVCVLAVCAAALLRLAASPLDGVVRGTDTDIPRGYRPPIISNGELNLGVDFTFGTCPREYLHYSTPIWWEGRRAGNSGFHLIEQGRFRTVLEVDGVAQGLPREWEQTLDIRAAVVQCRNRYAGGVSMEGSAFVPFGHTVIALRQTFSNETAAVRQVCAGIEFELTTNRWTAGGWRDDAPVGELLGTWRSYGRRVWDSCVSVFGYRTGGKESAAVFARPGATSGSRATVKSFSLAPGETCTYVWFILFTDSCEDTMRTGRGQNVPRTRTDVATAAQWARTNLRTRGFNALFAAHRAAWADYYAESEVRLPEPALQRLADMAAYHLRCVATKWSFPVGIFESHWKGAYFGFDEMYIHHGLASANHLDTARRCPDFRRATLDAACYRNRHYGKPGKHGARWTWMNEEDGVDEMAVMGFWVDHVFHMSHIAKSCWMQYLYSGNLVYLRETGYPVILECARFFRNCMTYEDANGGLFIGKCTDIERLGPAVERAFLTTCGAIYTLEAAADAAALLAADADEAADFRATAAKLRAGLPERDGRYVAFPGCREESVVTLGGYFPYPVVPPDNAAQRAAARHFFANGRAAGNMYPRGTQICPWYAGWMSAAATYMDDGAEAIRWLREAASVAGLFGEYFEINEPGSEYHPWFATAAGTCLFALNQMLVCDAGGETRLACAVPEGWTDYAFRLPCQKGVLIDMAVTGGRLTRLVLSLQKMADETRLTLVLRDTFAATLRTARPAISASGPSRPGFFKFDVTVTNNRLDLLEEANLRQDRRQDNEKGSAQ